MPYKGTGLRTHILDEQTCEQMRELFINANNAHRWLNLEAKGVNHMTLARAMRMEACRESDLVDIEGAWDNFCQEHSLTKETFDTLSPLQKTRGNGTGTTRRLTKRQDQEYVEESFDENDGEAEYF